MYQDITGLEFQGSAFDKVTDLTLFPKANNPTRVCFMYGKNGSGKSTLSKACYQALDSEKVEGIENSSFIDSNNKKIQLTEDEKKHIFVFNENYTEQKIKFKENGLETIVLLGKQINLDAQLEELTHKLQTKKEEQSTAKEELDKFLDAKNSESPDFLLKQITKILKEDGGWADRKKRINRNTTKARVSNDTFLSIMQKEPKKNSTLLISEFNEKMKVYNKTENDDMKELNLISPLEVLSHTDKDIESLLSLKLQKPEFSEREQYLFGLIQGGKGERVTEMETVFSKETTKECPFCFQPISIEHKSHLLDSIRNVLNKEAEQHKKDLLDAQMSPYEIDFSQYAGLIDNPILQKSIQAQNSINQALEKINNALNKKIINIYVPITDISFCLQEKWIDYKESLAQIQIKINDYNTALKNKDRLKKELLSLNDKIAYYELKNNYSQYERAATLKSEKETSYQLIISDIKNFEEDLDSLRQQKKNIKIAVDVINRDLNFIFYSKKRLKIEANGDIYTLYSNGLPVKPKNISSGERNIISLCYFFTEIMQNLDNNDKYKQSCFLVIDDPLSSFDFDNKVGILSFLKDKMKNILSGSPDSKIILMTHDLSILNPVDKIFKNIKLSLKDKQKFKLSIYHCELVDKKIKEITMAQCNDYLELLHSVYLYAENPKSEYNLVIGNMIRRVLEAFSTFKYKEGIDALFSNDKLFDASFNTNRKQYGDYFQRLIDKITFDEESHMKDRSTIMDNPCFTSLYTEESKQQIAKDSLCLLFIIDPQHIRAYLNHPSEIENIKSWCKEILEK